MLSMNASIKDSFHPAIVYYDSDYPSRYYPVHPENYDEIVWQQGIADDVDKYKQLTTAYGKHVLELCCGTGRVSIPLVMDECQVTAVDVSAALLRSFKNKIEDIADFPTQNLVILKQDVTNLSLHQTNYDIVICAFNSLLCIPDFQQQQQTLWQAARHLRP